MNIPQEANIYGGPTLWRGVYKRQTIIESADLQLVRSTLWARDGEEGRRWLALFEWSARQLNSGAIRNYADDVGGIAAPSWVGRCEVVNLALLEPPPPLPVWDNRRQLDEMRGWPGLYLTGPAPRHSGKKPSISSVEDCYCIAKGDAK